MIPGQFLHLHGVALLCLTETLGGGLYIARKLRMEGMGRKVLGFEINARLESKAYLEG